MRRRVEELRHGGWSMSQANAFIRHTKARLLWRKGSGDVKSRFRGLVGLRLSAGFQECRSKRRSHACQDAGWRDTPVVEQTQIYLTESLALALQVTTKKSSAQES